MYEKKEFPKKLINYGGFIIYNTWQRWQGLVNEISVKKCRSLKVIMKK